MYSFRRNPVGLGIGVEKMGFERPSTLPLDSLYSQRRNVQASLGPQSPGAVKLKQNLVSVGLIGNGLYFQGTLALQQLQEFDAAKGKATNKKG